MYNPRLFLRLTHELLDALYSQTNVHRGLICSHCLFTIYNVTDVYFHKENEITWMYVWKWVLELYTRHHLLRLLSLQVEN